MFAQGNLCEPIPSNLAIRGIEFRGIAARRPDVGANMAVPFPLRALDKILPAGVIAAGVAVAARGISGGANCIGATARSSAFR